MLLGQEIESETVDGFGQLTNTGLHLEFFLNICGRHLIYSRSTLGTQSTSQNRPPLSDVVDSLKADQCIGNGTQCVFNYIPT